MIGRCRLRFHFLLNLKLASGIGDTGFNPVCWYQRDLQLRRPAASERILLHFGAVDYRASVWVNEQEVARHEGGHTPFEADITAALKESGEQTISVRAEEGQTRLATGPSRNVASPHHGDLAVWIERVPETHIGRLRWTTNLVGWSIQFEAKIVGGRADDLTIDLELRYDQRLLARDSYQIIDSEADRQIILSDPGIDDFRNELLWSPARPTLIDAEVRLRRGQEVIDRVTSYTAF